MKRFFCAMLCFLLVSPSWASPRWGIYINGVVGFGCSYPDIFSASKDLRDNLGLLLTSEDSAYKLLICGSPNDRNLNGLQMLQQRLDSLQKTDSFVGTMDNYSILYRSDGRLIYEYRVLNLSTWASFLFSYPEEEAGQWEEVIEVMKEKLLLF